MYMHNVFPHHVVTNPTHWHKHKKTKNENQKTKTKTEKLENVKTKQKQEFFFKKQKIEAGNKIYVYI